MKVLSLAPPSILIKSHSAELFTLDFTLWVFVHLISVIL